ncbi:amino acid ABC transporter permease [Actinomadura rayongensis]|uniref:ABC transporter permease subunit n=1 Tax=Actinomadura rayongensis TaxID=1429076 RepID=A0A6I4W633_9ACTN|nr:amino acid ABC transporter permease [Actinomadura rayongensis]MXQ63656.1 ABC transporter permease subunit [Actinomadura rayongensis]
MSAGVLFDVPGPRARARNRIITVVASLLLLGLAALFVWRMNAKGQWAGELWNPFLKGQIWRNFILPGLKNTLGAAAVATVLALIFGALFGIGRLSDHWWIRVPCGVIVEFFRAMPLLIMIFLAFFLPNKISPVIAESSFGTLQRVLVDNFFSIFGVEINAGTVTVPAFAAVVFGLVMYNGSVFAEIVRAGINAVPKGQAEAGYAIGLRKSGVLLRILLPQAVTVMMPAIVAQIVVLLKDTAIGVIIAYPELLKQAFREIPPNFHNNILQAGIVVGAIYIALNLAISRLAVWLERRSRGSRRTAAPTMGAGGAPPAPGMSATGTATGAD